MMCRMVVVAWLILASTSSLRAQSCPSGCLPPLRPGCSRPTGDIHFSFCSNFSQSDRDAIAAGLGAWNAYFNTNNVSGGFTQAGDNSYGADTIIYIDSTLSGTTTIALASLGPGHIRVNPDYLGQNTTALTAFLMHEAGHNLCYDDVNTAGCKGSTVMFGAIDSVAGPFYSDLLACDITKLAVDYPPSNPPPPQGEGGFDDGCPTCIGRGFSPILIDLGSGSYRLTGLENPVPFDLNADGVTDECGWTPPATSIAFLARDLNGNGVIDDGSELFGNATIKNDGSRARNGFEALAELDSDGNGEIDTADLAWPSLLLWIDQNHDGVSQPNELIRLATSGLTSLSLRYHWTGRRDRSGNVFRYEGTAQFGRSRRSIYDVWLVTQ